MSSKERLRPMVVELNGGERWEVEGGKVKN
jgi:hypothetical protein